MGTLLVTKSVFGSGAVFRGKISKVGAVDIHGEVHADMKLDKLVLKEGAILKGDVRVSLGVMAGSFTGSLQAHSIWVMKTASLLGEIEYAALQMDRGAALNCRIKHNWDLNSQSANLHEGEDILPELSLTREVPSDNSFEVRASKKNSKEKHHYE